jgi:FMN phosphatase YigB (HAD superfamily)
MEKQNIEELLTENPNLKGIICDLDGTLYHQKPLRRKMFWALAKHYFFRVGKWKQLYSLYLFRKIREDKAFAQTSYEQQLLYVSKKVNLDKGELHDVIQYWMFQYPMDLIQQYANTHLLQILIGEQRKGKKIIVYSDYPVENKLQRLGMTADYIFYPGKNGINVLKPSMSAMKCILENVHMDVTELIYIGDRQEKDGASARLVGMDFILV